MKYKVGEKVKIRSDLVGGEVFGGLRWLKGMEGLSGNVLTIEYISGIFCCFKETDYVLAEEMIECSVEDIELECVERTTLDNVNHPKHYNVHKHECIEEMIAVFGIEAVKIFCKLNVWKYRYRSGAKDGHKDLKKADKYMDILMELNNEEKI